MSFLSAISKTIKNSGLEELMAEVYAENNVKHTLSGKAVSRAFRTHFFIESSIISSLFETIKKKCKIDFINLKNFVGTLYKKTEMEIN